jgi:integrase
VQYSGGAYHLRDRTKTDEPRTLPLPDVTREAFERQNLIQLWERSEALTWQEHPFGQLVFTNRTGGPLHGPYARRRLQTVLARAGLPRLTLYQLRHTGATLLLRLGAPLEQVREIMGHSRVEMTLGYVDAAEDLQRDALGRLDAFLREG